MDRRKLIRQGLEAILRSTAVEAEEGVGQEAGAPPAEPKRHTSVYLYPSEFELLEEIIFRLRREHGVRIKKSDLWRALLHLGWQFLKDPERAASFASTCAEVADKRGWEEDEVAGEQLS